MAEPDPFAPVTDLTETASLDDWRFIIGASAQARLLTAMGDVFVLRPHGILRRPQVFLLDTFAGNLVNLKMDWQAFKQRMATPDPTVAAWLKYDLLRELDAAGKHLQSGECFSPIIPSFLGGKYEPATFTPKPWRTHLSAIAKLLFQVKDLPPGTRITSIELE